MGILEIKNVAYSYANSKEKVLSGVNQKFELGKFYAIVGQNSRIPCRKLSTTAGAEWCVLSFNTKAVRIFLSNCAIILEKRTKIAYNPNCEKKRRKM